MKKLCSLILSVVLLLAVFPLGTATVAAAGNQCGDNITWTLEDGVLTLSGSGDMWHYDFWYNTVPWELDRSTITKVVVEEGITSLGTNAFVDCLYLTDVELPASLKVMGMNSFAGCERLLEFTVPVGLESFDCSAFANCTAMLEYKVAAGNTHFTTEDGVLFSADKTALWSYPIGRTDDTYIMPDTVTSVEAYAFSEAAALTAIGFSENLKTIGDEAFHNCVGLTEIELPEGFLSTGGGSFQGCEKLSVIKLPDSLRRVGPLCFDQTAYYNNIDNWENQLVLYLDDVVLAGREEWDEVGGESGLELGGQYVIREGTRIVGDEAFDFLAIDAISFPSTLETIGEGAFYGCDNLTEITVPDRVTHIYEIAFNSCENLAVVNLPDGLQHIGYDAFEDTAYMDNAAAVGGIVYNNTYVLGAFTPLTDANITEGTTLIAEFAFAGVGSNLKSVTLPESLRIIGAEAFLNNTAVGEITVPKDVTTIGDYAFGYSRRYDGDAEMYVYTKRANFTLSGYTDSVAEAYAAANGIPFVRLDGCSHQYTAAVTTPNTCTAPGVRTYTCALCGDSYTEEIPAGHTYVTIPAVAPGCNTPGQTEGIKCSVCDLVISEPFATGTLGHRVRSVDRINPECNKDGWTEGSWCEDCQKYVVEPERIPATGDHLVYSFTDEYPSCTREGRTGGTFCGRCGETLTPPTVLPMTEHKYLTVYSVEHPATETEVGSMSRKCMNCNDRTDRQELPTVQPLTVESTPQGVKLTWPAYDGAVYYRLYREVVGDGNGASMLTTTFNTFYTDKTAQKGVTYRYSLELLNYQQDTMANTNQQEITFTVDHQYSGDCDRFCNLCGEERAIEGLHDFDPANCQMPMICRVCGEPFGELGKHRYGEGTLIKMPTCSEEGEMAYSCLFCDHAMTERLPKLDEHVYDEGKVTKAATCKEEGVKTYTCVDCKATKTESIGKKSHTYADATCTKAKTCKVCGATSGKKLGHRYSSECDTSCNRCKATRKVTHSYKTVTKKATATANGYTLKRCTVCDKETGKTTYYKASTVKLSKTSYTYSGKAVKPSVTIKDSKGKTVSSSNYTVTYASGRKNVGTYKVTVKFKGKYSGTKTLTFKVIPRAASVNKLTAKAKAITVKLNRSLKQSTGYEVQYSTSKTFKSAKVKTVKSYKTSSVSLTGLKAKKTYYVRVRTYKTVGGKKVYSNWSSYKSVKTK